MSAISRGVTRRRQRECREQKRALREGWPTMAPRFVEVGRFLAEPGRTPAEMAPHALRARWPGLTDREIEDALRVRNKIWRRPSGDGRP